MINLKFCSAFVLSTSIFCSGTFANSREAGRNYSLAGGDEQSSEFFKRLLGAYTNDITEYSRYWLVEKRNSILRSDKFKYDAVMVTLAAGLESRGYPRGKWNQSLVSMTGRYQDQAYYSKPVRLYHKFKNTGAGEKLPLVISLGSSYSTWKRGTWMNKIVDLTEQNLDGQVHFIALPGFLSAEVLAFGPKFPDIQGNFIAADLRARILALVENRVRAGFGIDLNKVFVMGYSGGATIALHMAAQESTARRRLVTGGVLAFSPVLDLQTSNSILDNAHDRARARGVKAGLTTLGTLFKNLGGSTSYQSVIELQGSMATNAAKRDHLTQLFYNEFTVVDLNSVVGSSQSQGYSPELPAGDGTGFSYRDYFERFALNKLNAENKLHQMDFERATDIVPIWRQIESKNLIIFAMDDPVLAMDPERGTTAKKIVTQLQKLRRTAPQLQVFTPKRGGHMGYFLDTPWLKTTLKNFITD